MDRNVVTQLISHVQKRINIYVAVIIAFSYHFIFEKDLPCTCNYVIRDCVVYMLLPFCIIFMAQLWMDRSLQRSCRRGDCCLVCSHLLSVFFVSCIWPISALIDGDWSVCCWSQSSHNVTCKNNNLCTDEERDIVRAVKDESRVWGLSILLGLFFIAFVISFCPSYSKHLKRRDWLEIVEEEEEKIFSDELRNMAKDQLRKKMEDLKETQTWAEDYTIGNEVLDYLAANETMSGTEPPSVPPSGTASIASVKQPLCLPLELSPCPRLKQPRCPSPTLGQPLVPPQDHQLEHHEDVEEDV